MRAKRSKQYRKLMREYCRIWNFREPYQVLVDADIVKDASRFKMDLVPALERTLHGKVKPMITQCSMRHLYSQQGKEPGMKEVVDYAKETFERRRCGHHPDETDALSTLECLSSFISNSEKHLRNRYVVASQDESVRRYMRGVKGVPLIYISRSVMILEPMADASAAVVAKEERAKFRSEIKSLASAGSKRKRGGDDDDAGADDDDNSDQDDDSDANSDESDGDGEGARNRTKAESRPVAPDGATTKAAKKYGPKGPNPLAAKKKKKKNKAEPGGSGTKGTEAAVSAPAEEPAKKKRKRRPKKSAGAGTAEGGAPVSAPTASEAVFSAEIQA